MDPALALLEAGVHIVVEVPDATVVRTHAIDQRYRYCFCGPNVGLIGHENLMAALEPDTSNSVVIVVNTRAIEALQNDYFAL